MPQIEIAQGFEGNHTHYFSPKLGLLGCSWTKDCIKKQYFARAVPVPSSLRLVPPAELPHVWHVDELATEGENIATGYPALDAQLPGAGLPVGSMVEVLQARGEQHVWQLLLPGLAILLAWAAALAVYCLRALGL